MADEDPILQQLELLNREIESATDPAIRERLRNVIGILLDFHGRALAQLMRILGQAGESSQSVTETLGSDDLVTSLLLLHDLHPWDVHTRLARAFERANQRWASEGIRVELVDTAADGVVRVRCAKMRGDRLLLKASIERVVYAAVPDAAGVTIEGLDDKAHVGFVPLTAVRILRRTG